MESATVNINRNSHDQKLNSLFIPFLFFTFLSFTLFALFQIRCDRLEPTCSSCIKYKAQCFRTCHSGGISSFDNNGQGIRVTTSSNKRDRNITEAEILDSCLRNVQSLQMNRLRRIEQFFDRLNIDETRLDEIGWIADQVKSHQECNPTSSFGAYQYEEVKKKNSISSLIPPLSRQP